MSIAEPTGQVPPHGGRRPGSGRKPGSDWDGTGEYEKKGRKQYSMSLDPVNRKWLVAEAARRGCTLADVMNDVLAAAREASETL